MAFDIFLSLTYSLRMIIFRSILVAANGLIFFFLWLSSIPPCVCTRSSLSMNLLVDTWVVSQVFAIEKSAATNMGEHVSFWIRLLSGYNPSSGIARPHDNSIFSFLRTFHTIIFVIVVAPVYMPTNSIGGFPFLYTQLQHLLSVDLNDGHSN